jgi:dTDP-4-amino-4,6-dideoxygalactose transaminase
MSPPLPTFRPRLPPTEALVPWLRDIDANRWYSNFGPLARLFEADLATHFGVENGRVITVANATLGITVALRNAADNQPGLCLMPAWSHPAPAIAAVNARLTPWFADVDRENWQLTPETARRLLPHAAAPVRAILVVSPFGGAVDLSPWARLAEETGVPVIVDAAAGFDSVRASDKIVQIVSLHATKVFGIGEGGFVLADTASRADRLRRMTNFGLDRHRHQIMPGCNAKLSEYAAAVGLAALRRWMETREDFLALSRRFRTALSQVSGVTPAPVFHDEIATSTANVVLDQPDADRVIAVLRERGIEGRKWWMDGAHRHPQLADCPCEAVPVADDLAARTVGLPFFIDMTDAEIDRVMAGLAAAIEPTA